MEILECLSWISVLWDRIQGKSNTSIYLPYEIIFNIFTRLPAELVFHCGMFKSLPSSATSGFIDMHLRRSEPIICFQHYTFPALRAGETKYNVDISFTDDKAKKITRKSLKLDSCCGSMPVLYGSYRGLLVFADVYHPVVYIQNPVTQSHANVVPPGVNYGFRGFYFHPASREYRVLYEYNKGWCFEYIVLSLKTKSSRKIGNSLHALSDHKLPIVFNGALHWMINDKACKDVARVPPRCSCAIVVFNMDSEEFCTMPHPGGYCYRSDSHHKMMDFMECDGKLCLSDASWRKKVVIWTLDDYRKRSWVKRHVINIEPVKQHCVIPVGCNCVLDDYIQAIHIFGNELLLRVFHSDLFLYNLRSGAFRRVGRKCCSWRSFVSPVVHTGSLVSLHTDGIVSLSLDLLEK